MRRGPHRKPISTFSNYKVSGKYLNFVEIGWSTQVKNILEFIRDDRGAELAEYAVGTAILVAVAIIVYQILGDAVNNKMNAVASEIDQ